MNKNIITIATDKKIYVDFAVNLAYSFLLWHNTADIKFYIVTDRVDLVPENLLKKIEIIEVDQNQLGSGFSSKLYLDQISPKGQTLFIDSDCLIFGNLNTVFEKFKGHPVSVIGNFISTGEWFGNIEKICETFHINKIPKFNGGVYYLERSEIATRIYEQARSIEKKYDEIGFVRLRNKPNDEVIMALSMELNGLKPIDDDGSILGDPLAYPAPYKINIETGKRLLKNPSVNNPKHGDWNKNVKAKPLIIHFLGSHTDDYQYKREVIRLKYLSENNLTTLKRTQIIFSLHYIPKFKIFVKKIFRPAFRLIFGNRKIKISERVDV